MLIKMLRRLLAAHPTPPQLGFVNAYRLFQQGALDEAVRACLDLDEESAGAGNICFLRGLIAEKQDDLDAAMRYFRLAISQNDMEFAFHLGLARVAGILEQQDVATIHYRRALDLMDHDNPSRASVLTNLALAHQAQGDVVSTKECYQRALQLKPDPALELRRALTLPAINQSVEEIADTRAEFDRELDELLDRRLPSLLHPEYEVNSTTPFYLAYHGLNDKRLMQKLARVYRSIYPTQVENTRRPNTENRKIKIGFVSTFFFSHSIGRTTFGLIHDLPRDRFEVEVFSISPKTDTLAEAIRTSCDRYVCLPGDLDKIRKTIEDAHLDILFFADIGMHPITYFLAFWRLAPIQITTWGHPVTTGIDTIDYFISAESIETAESDDHYSETLVRLGGFYQPRYARVSLDGPRRSHDALGLPPSMRLYLCPQNLFKLHPDFDSAMRQILEQDRESYIILLESNVHFARSIRERFQRTLGPLASRIHFVPLTANHASFLHLIASANVILDPFHFGGNNTSSEALALGIPVVTLPSPFVRGRFTLGLYRELAIEDCIAQSPEDYAAIAVRLGRDREFREMVGSKIADRSDVLFDRPDAAYALAQKLETIVAARL